MIIQFGKYRGQLLSAIPDEYLTWLVKRAAEDLNLYIGEQKRRAQVNEAQMPWAERVIQAGLHSLAHKYHPDKGGSEDDMKSLNAAVEALKEMVRSLT